MKDKVLESEITKSVEKIAKSLRFYSKLPIFCNISISTRDEDDQDFYLIKCNYYHKTDRGDVPILQKSALVEYTIDKKHELIRRVIPIEEEGEEDE